MGNTKKTPKKKSKKELNETIARIEAIGQEDEKKGIEETQKLMKQFDEENKIEDLKKVDKLGKATKFNKKEYYRVVAQMLEDEAYDMDIPPGYVPWSEPTDDGVILHLKDFMGKEYYRAMKPSGIEKIDYNAVIGMLIDMQDQIDLLQHNRRNSGIILPSDITPN